MQMLWSGGCSLQGYWWYNLWCSQNTRKGLVLCQKSALEKTWSCQHVLENVCLVFRFYKQNWSLNLAHAISFLWRPGLASGWEVEVFPICKTLVSFGGHRSASSWHRNIGAKIILNLKSLKWQSWQCPFPKLNSLPSQKKGNEKGWRASTHH